jgi:hypothetical protein
MNHRISTVPITRAMRERAAFLRASGRGVNGLRGMGDLPTFTKNLVAIGGLIALLAWLSSD